MGVVRLRGVDTRATEQAAYLSQIHLVIGTVSGGVELGNIEAGKVARLSSRL